MLIIPGFTLATAGKSLFYLESLFKIISDKSHNFTEIFANIYISDSGMNPSS
jgi:hypothetical protein